MKSSKSQSKTQNWELKKIGEVCEKLSLIKAPANSWPYIEISDVNIENKSFIFKEKKSVNGAVIAPQNSVIVSRVRPTRGAIALLDQDRVISSAFTILKIKNSEGLPKFLFYSIAWSKKFLTYLQRKQKGSTYPSVREKDVLNFEIPIPSLPVQHQIVERLDAIRKAQELNDKQIALAEELFQSLLHRELNPTDKNWQVKRLGEVVTNLLNGFPSRPVTEDKGTPQFRPHNIGLDGSLIFEGIKFVPRKIKNIEKYFLKKDDVIFNNTNSVEQVGKTAYVDQDHEIAFSNHLTRIRVDQTKIKGYYLALLLNYLYKRRKFQTLCTPWVNQAAVNSHVLKSIKIHIPPLETQRHVVEKLQAVHDYKKSLLAQKEKLKELFESTLDKAMKGELVS